MVEHNANGSISAGLLINFFAIITMAWYKMPETHLMKK